MYYATAMLDEWPRECFEAQERWLPANKLDQEPHSKEWYLVHFAMGLAGEAGESLEAAKKVHNNRWSYDKAKFNLEGELADVFMYLFDLCHILDLEPSTIIRKKMEYNNGRFAQELLDRTSRK